MSRGERPLPQREGERDTPISIPDTGRQTTENSVEQETITEMAQKEIISRNKTKATFPSIITPTHLPAHGGLLAGEDVLCERRRLQLIFVEGEVVNHHGLLTGAGELHIGVSTPRRLGKGV